MAKQPKGNYSPNTAKFIAEQAVRTSQIPLNTLEGRRYGPPVQSIPPVPDTSKDWVLGWDHTTMSLKWIEQLTCSD